MKKFFAFFILLSIIILCSCSAVDVNLTNKEDLYSQIADVINNPSDYSDKTVKITAEHSVVYNFSENKIARHVLVVNSKSGTSKALYEIKSSDENYPKLAKPITVTGRFVDKYIDVKAFDSAEFSNDIFDIDTLKMSSSELEQFIKQYTSEYRDSEHFERTIRIFGHCINESGYYYLFGLDEKGAMTWTIELYNSSEGIKFPVKQGTEVNPVEIIGTLSIYFENNIAYACIDVSSVTEVESVFK